MKRTKRIAGMLCLILAVAMLAVSCANSVPPDAGSTADSDTTTTASGEPTGDNPSETTTDSGTSGDEAPSVSEAPKTLKILAIGNSFSTDGMEYLYAIAKNLGVETVVLGNLYIGGCSLATHLSHAKSGEAAYTYYKNTTGAWVTTKNKTMLQGIEDEEWDYISLQQTSKTSGLSDSYGSTLTELVDFVDGKKPGANTKLVWHMTWAYQQDSTHTSFPNYNSNQTTMYNMIVSATKECILTNSKLGLVIPCGTSIQNARTSFVGDTLTRDGYHLSNTLGRYIAALTWYAAITGAPIDEVSYSPATEISGDTLKMAVESVKNAISAPFEVTESTFKTGTIVTGTSQEEIYTNPDDFFEADKALALTNSINLDNYKLLEVEYENNAYWYCTKGFNLTYPAATAGTYNENICTKKIFSKTEVPEGSIIICDAGWQYRPELWVNMTDKAASRPAITTQNFTVMSAEWWGSNNYFAYNISSSPKTDISAKFDIAGTHVRVYVPVVNS